MPVCLKHSALQVWVEVQHCEERVQLLCTITRAVETHVSILQDELCKVSLYFLSPFQATESNLQMLSRDTQHKIQGFCEDYPAAYSLSLNEPASRSENWSCSDRLKAFHACRHMRRRQR